MSDLIFGGGCSQFRCCVGHNNDVRRYVLIGGILPHNPAAEVTSANHFRINSTILFWFPPKLGVAVRQPMAPSSPGNQIYVRKMKILPGSPIPLTHRRHYDSRTLVGRKSLRAFILPLQFNWSRLALIGRMWGLWCSNMTFKAA